MRCLYTPDGIVVLGALRNSATDHVHHSSQYPFPRTGKKTTECVNNTRNIKFCPSPLPTPARKMMHSRRNSGENPRSCTIIEPAGVHRASQSAPGREDRRRQWYFSGYDETCQSAMAGFKCGVVYDELQEPLCNFSLPPVMCNWLFCLVAVPAKMWQVVCAANTTTVQSLPGSAPPPEYSNIPHMKRTSSSHRDRTQLLHMVRIPSLQHIPLCHCNLLAYCLLVCWYRSTPLLFQQLACTAPERAKKHGGTLMDQTTSTGDHQLYA